MGQQHYRCQRSRRLTVFLDIDETLVHSVFERGEDNRLQLRQAEDRKDTYAAEEEGIRADEGGISRFEIRLGEPPVQHRVWVNKRPGLDEFLAALAARKGRDGFRVVAFTAGVEMYGSALLEVLDPNGEIFDAQFYRDSCTLVGSAYVKDLRIPVDELRARDAEMLALRKAREGGMMARLRHSLTDPMMAFRTFGQPEEEGGVRRSRARVRVRTGREEDDNKRERKERDARRENEESGRVEETDEKKKDEEEDEEGNEEMEQAIVKEEEMDEEDVRWEYVDRETGRFDLSRVVLVDNNPLSFHAQRENGILIRSFYDDPRDRELSEVLKMLDIILDADEGEYNSTEVGGLAAGNDTSVEGERSDEVSQEDEEEEEVGDEEESEMVMESGGGGNGGRRRRRKGRGSSGSGSGGSSSDSEGSIIQSGSLTPWCPADARVVLRQRFDMINKISREFDEKLNFL